MKNILTLAAGVLCSTLVFADGKLSTSSSTSAVMNSGSGLIKVFYKAPKSNNVTVVILNEKKEEVFSEKMRSESFMRPYNFRNLPDGQYTILIEDATGTYTEKIDYQFAEAGKKVNVSKIESEDGRYLISGFLPSSDDLSINIYDKDNKLIFHDKLNASGKFARVYNLSSVKGEFTIDISDDNGSLKDFSSGFRK